MSFFGSPYPFSPLFQVAAYVTVANRLGISFHTCILAPLSGELLMFKILTVAVMKKFLSSFKNIFLFINSELTQWILICSFLPLLLT
jgi:hypothetical protein